MGPEQGRRLSVEASAWGDERTPASSAVDISVIVPVRDGASTISACLTALEEQTMPRSAYELIVVDDGSTDGTVDLVCEQDAVLLSQPPRGPAAARNRGARQAVGAILVFTDADCSPAEDFLTRISAPFEDPAVMGVKGAYRTRQVGLVSRFVQQEYQHKYDRMEGKPSIDFVDTYAAAYRRNAFLQEGGFDERFTTASVEDQELSFRMVSRGYRLVFEPAAIVYHQHDRSLADYARRKFNIAFSKAKLLRLHPDRVGGDSHTPPMQRLQIVLVPAAILASLAGLISPFAGWTGAGLWLCALLSGLPEGSAILRRDPVVLVVAPLMGVTRALALAAGLAIGISVHRGGADQSLQPGLSLRQRIGKRILDLTLASIGLLFTAPILGLAALAIKLHDGGSVLFRQERAGESGRAFTMIKLRSMVPDAEAKLDQVLERNMLIGPTFKIEDDPRVTGVGRFLRRWSIDELPQLWNVLRGEMSMVGPRPEEVAVVEQYTPEQRLRLSVPPGLTGPMQVSGRGLLDVDQRLALEREYILHYSLRKDLAILLRSIGAVLRGRGAL